MNNLTKNIFFILFLSSFLLIVNCNAEELIPTEKNNKWGYCNGKDEISIPYQWDYCSEFRNNKTAIVGMYSKETDSMTYGIIDAFGNYVVPCEYFIQSGESESYFGDKNGYYLIKDFNLNLYGYFDIENNYFCTPKYSGVNIHLKNPENIISVCDPNTSFWGYIIANNENPVSDFCYIITGPWNNGSAIADSLEGQYILLSDGNRVMIPEIYYANYSINKGLFIITNMDNQYGLMNLEGAVATHTWYDYIEYCDNENYVGYIDGDVVEISTFQTNTY